MSDDYDRVKDIKSNNLKKYEEELYKLRHTRAILDEEKEFYRRSYWLSEQITKRCLEKSQERKCLIRRMMRERKIKRLWIRKSGI